MGNALNHAGDSNDGKSAPPAVNRAYGVFTIKSISEEERVIEGIASTPNPDRMGDVIEPMGVKFSLPLPLLWQHDSAQPIGHVEYAKASASGITFRAKVAKIADPGMLRDRVDNAWQTLKSGLVRGMSIGFRALEYSFMDTGGIHFLSSEWMELSCVTIPANSDASIQSIKSIDQALLAATGRKAAPVRLSPPGASGKSHSRKPAKEANEVKTIADQIKEWEAKRAAKFGRMETIMSTAAEDDRTLDGAESEEHDTLAGEVKKIDEHLVRLNAQQASMASQAKAIRVVDTDSGSRERQPGSGIQVLEPKLEKGIGFARIVKCIARAKFDDVTPMEVAKTYYPNYTPLQEIMKMPGITKTIGAATTEASSWAAPLVNYQILANEFIEFLRPRTIIGQFGQGNVPSLRRVPFKVKVPRMTSGTSGYWVGQGKPKPLSNGAMDSVTLDFSKVAAISVITDELARLSTPSAEMIVRDDLAAAVIQRIDTDFVDPTLASSANVHPASITYNASTVVSSGDDITAVRTDLKALLAPMIQANIPIGNIVLVMNENTALGLALMQTSLGVDAFPGMTPTGGILLGHPVVVSQYVPSAVVIAVAPNEVMLADDGNVAIDVSREASLEMLSGSLVQDGTAGTAASLVSMWQNNMLAIRAEREINWALRRAAAVTYLSSANWGGGANSGDI